MKNTNETLYISKFNNNTYDIEHHYHDILSIFPKHRTVTKHHQQIVANFLNFSQNLLLTICFYFSFPSDMLRFLFFLNFINSILTPSRSHSELFEKYV